MLLMTVVVAWLQTSVRDGYIKLVSYDDGRHDVVRQHLYQVRIDGNYMINMVETQLHGV